MPDISISPGDEFSPEVAAEIARIRADAGIDPGVAGAPGGELDRRSFLKLSAVAAVAAMAAGCSKDPDTLVPYKAQPEGSVLGKPRFYASTLRASGRPVAVTVKTYDGRPIKIEGNPDCPIGRGRADLRTQAALLDLYDPDRLRQPVVRSGDRFQPAAWNDLDAQAGAALRQGRIGLLTGPIDGPARRKLVDDLAAAFGDRLRHAVFSATDSGAQAEAVAEAFGGEPAAPRWHLGKAKVLLHLGGDFLADQGLPGQVAFGDFRVGDGSAPGQIIAIEPVLSQTGTVADVRIRCAPDRVAWAAWRIAALVAKAKGEALPAAAARALETAPGELDLAPIAAADAKPLHEACAALGLPAASGEAIPALIYAALRLLQAGPGASLVYAGGATHDGAGSRSLLAAVHYLNGLLGNLGSTVTIDRGATWIRPGDRRTAWPALRDACAGGAIDTLIVCGANPVFADPAAAAALAKVPRILAIAERIDETARLAGAVAPMLHDLEDWGDAEPAPGVMSLQQPAIRPLWDARSAAESLMAWTVAALGEAAPAGFRQPVQPDPADLSDHVTVIDRAPLWLPGRRGVQSWAGYLRAHWATLIPAAAWNETLAAGVVHLGAQPAPAAGVPRHTGSITPPVAFTRDGDLRLVATPSRTLGGGDGASANNAWLLETPDPVSRITWDAYLAISPADAVRLGLDENAVAAIAVGGFAAELPVHLQDGQHPGTAEIFLGWGRAADCAGGIADLGRDVLPLANAYALAERWGARVEIKPAGKRFVLACPQGHDRMEGRDIARDRVLGAAPRHGHHAAWVAGVDGRPGGRLSLHGKTIPYDGHRWGMSIDMSLCMACNACVVACSAENNVPVVGRDEVRRGRLMHWIRIDRYFTGDERNRLDVEVLHQPMLCQHCEKAPCEAVCPANATMHNDEGLNIQVYNRCIGTRYCANNCPYKVRRFNWYEYSAYRAGPVTGAGAVAPATRIVRNVIHEGRTSAGAEYSEKPLALLLNPDVTVRSRGVMEKCNFCLQRTRDIRDRSRAEGRLRDQAVTTACAQTCPTRAIVFGDLNEPTSEVARLAALPEGHRVLDKELNTRPAVTYQPRLRHRPLAPGESASAHGAHATKEGA